MSQPTQVKRDSHEDEFEPSASASGRGIGHVLVVDDDPRNCRLLNSLLTRRGYDVVQASSGEEALSILNGTGGGGGGSSRIFNSAF